MYENGATGRYLIDSIIRLVVGTIGCLKRYFLM